MSEERISGAGGVLFDDGKVLVVVEDDDSPEYLKFRGQLSVPLGHVDPGEELMDAARREVLEEAGLRVKVVDFLGCYQVGTGNANMFLMKLEKGEEAGNLGGELDPRWMPIDELLREPFLRPPTLEAVRRAVEVMEAA